MWTRIQSLVTGTPVKCQHCGTESPLISQSLGLCSDCIRHHFDQVYPEGGVSYCGLRTNVGAKATGLNRVKLGNIHLLHD